MVTLTDRPDMTLDVYRGRKTTKQQQQQIVSFLLSIVCIVSWFLYLPSSHQFPGGTI